MPVVERVRQLRTLENPPVDAFSCPFGPTEFTNVQLQEADVLDLESLPSEGTNYNLVVSASMLEYVPRGELAASLKQLRTRLAPRGALPLFIAPKNWMPKLLIEKWWKANRYTREEFRNALAPADFQATVFIKFHRSYFWLNLSSNIVEGGSYPHDPPLSFFMT